MNFEWIKICKKGVEEKKIAFCGKYVEMGCGKNSDYRVRVGEMENNCKLGLERWRVRLETEDEINFESEWVNIHIETDPQKKLRALYIRAPFPRFFSKQQHLFSTHRIYTLDKDSGHSLRRHALLSKIT